MSKAPNIYVGGHLLNERFLISGLKRTFPESRLTHDDIPGMRGTYVKERTMGTRSVTITLSSISPSRDHGRMLEDISALATWLFESDMLDLSISDEDGRLRKVVLDGGLDYNEYEERGSVTIKLLQPDPLCIVGSPQTVQVPSGGSAAFSILHSYPIVSISAESVVRDSTTELWGVRFDGGACLYVRLLTSGQSRVSIDCENRSVFVNGAVSMVTLGSDWPDLAPGEHVVEMDRGSGVAKLTWRERCI